MFGSLILVSLQLQEP